MILRALSVPTGVAAYAYTLHWVYLNLVTEPFRYMGYTYSAPDFYTIVFTYLAATTAALFLPARIWSPSGLVLWLLFIVAVAPSILVPAYTGYQTNAEALVSGITIGACYILAIFITKRRQANSTKPLFRPMQNNFWLVISIFTVFVYGLVAVTMGLSLEFVAILDVYDVRDEYRSGLAGTSAIVGYLVSTQANVVNPLIIARGIYSRRWTLIATGVLGQALLFSGTGFKTILFSLPALLVFALILRRGHTPRSIWILWGGVAVAAVSAVVDYAQGGILWTSLFARRFLLTPGLLMSVYTAFYSTNPPAMLSHSILEGVLENPYNFAPARTVGAWITGNPASAFNANLFADGYANFGTLGMVGASIVLGVYLRTLDRAAVGLPLAISGLILVMPAIALSNTSVLTAMFSHGLVAAVILLALAPRNGWFIEKHFRKSTPARQDTK